MIAHPGRVVTTQATEDVWQFENYWSLELCECCNSIKKCCFAYCCFPCFLCGLFGRTGECYFTPIFIPLSLMALRTKLRTGFRIRGSICCDFCVSCCCPICAAIQLSNELDAQGL